MSRTCASSTYYRFPLLAILFLSLIAPAFAIDEINTTFIGNLAVEGYDTVAYFTENRPVRGQKQFSHQWKNATWRFSSAENLAAFKADPERYVPQYGGYCAYAVSQNYTASIEPDQFAVFNDKLYLNYDKKTRTKWLMNRDGYIKEADKNWPILLKESNH